MLPPPAALCVLAGFVWLVMPARAGAIATVWALFAPAICRAGAGLVVAGHVWHRGRLARRP